MDFLRRIWQPRSNGFNCLLSDFCLRHTLSIQLKNLSRCDSGLVLSDWSNLVLVTKIITLEMKVNM